MILSRSLVLLHLILLTFWRHNLSYFNKKKFSIMFNGKLAKPPFHPPLWLCQTKLLHNQPYCFPVGYLLSLLLISSVIAVLTRYNRSPESVDCQQEKLCLEADSSHIIQVSGLMSSRQLLMLRNGRAAVASARASVSSILQPAQSSAVMGTGIWACAVWD